MKKNLRSIAVSLPLAVAALLGLGCAQAPQLLAAIGRDPVELQAQGPGARFESIEAAAVDAVSYAYLQARAAHDTARMRSGTIFRVKEGYSYAEPDVASPLTPHRVDIVLRPQDVARFLMYPQTGRHDVDRTNERPSLVERRAVSITDPQHRPLYILHPSLVVRAYRGEDQQLDAVADLRHPARGLLFAGQ